MAAIVVVVVAAVMVVVAVMVVAAVAAVALYHRQVFVADTGHHINLKCISLTYKADADSGDYVAVSDTRVTCFMKFANEKRN